MQICHFLLLLEPMLFGLFSKENLNLLKSSQNSFLGLQPESGHRHSARFQLGEVGGGKKEPLSLLPLSSFCPACGTIRIGDRGEGWAFRLCSPVQSPWCGQATDWALTPGGRGLVQYCVLRPPDGHRNHPHLTPFCFLCRLGACFSRAAQRAGATCGCFISSVMQPAQTSLGCWPGVQSSPGPRGILSLPASVESPLRPLSFQVVVSTPTDSRGPGLRVMVGF